METKVQETNGTTNGAGKKVREYNDHLRLSWGQKIFKTFVATILKFFFRVETHDLDHVTKAGRGAVIVVNHVSFLDGVLMGAFLPGKPMFAIDTFMAKQWWAKPFLSLVDIFPMDPTNPMSMKSLIRKIEETGQPCVIFPEGRLTATGSLMKVYEGPGMIADKVGSQLVPVRIDGAQYSYFSRLKGKLRLRLFPKITIHAMEPQNIDVDEELKGKRRREKVGLQLYNIMSNLIFETCDYKRTLFEALLEARSVHGGRQVIAEDVNWQPLTYNKLLVGSFVLGSRLARFTKQGEHVGVLLPNSVGVAVTFFGLQAMGRIPAMLNFSTGSKNILSAIKAARIETVLTSRQFIEKGKLEHLIEGMRGKVRIVYLEDQKKKITTIEKLNGLFWRFLPSWRYNWNRAQPDDAAVVLFTSGSEGAPKGVVLSHTNLLANRYQLAARIDFNPTDKVFNALPVFHSFGLTGGFLLPILSGIHTFLYPSPLHYRTVSSLVYHTDATIMFGTDTFLNGYARVANPYDFYAVRYIFAGAEKVKDETRQIYANKFGVRILEGYGATETAPAITINTPMHFKAGSVGRLLPSIKADLLPVPGIDKGGRLVVTGPNIMKGYLRETSPGILEATEGQTYDTGDIVTIDDQGYITIEGRAKRFAKIAGEMVSLSAVETMLKKVWPEYDSAVVTKPDARKGEQLVIFTTHPKADRKNITQYAAKNGIMELMVPRDIRYVEKLPVLGTGKLDYVSMNEMVG